MGRKWSRISWGVLAASRSFRFRTGRGEAETQRAQQPVAYTSCRPARQGKWLFPRAYFALTRDVLIAPFRDLFPA